MPTVTTHGVTLEPDVKKWNEETQKFDIPVGKNDIKAVGKYLVTYHYDGTNTNYVSQTETVEITIEQANIAFNGITIDGWTYDDYEGSEPTVSVDEKFEFVLDLVQYQYAYWNAETNAWGEWIDWTDETDPTSFKAGKYRIKAILENDANGNYTGDEITDAEAFEFDIEKAVVTITAKVNGNTISDGATISKEYRPSGYTIAQILESWSASNGATTFTYTVDGNGVGADAITFTDVIVDGEGVYTLVISLDESDNYKATSLTVKVKITPATNTDSFTEVYNNIPYNSNLWTTIGTLPAGWSIQNMDGTATNEETTVGNYGKNEFKLVFNNGNNYNPREAVTITINVERADASITVKVDDEAISNGDTITLPYQAGGYVLSDIFQITASHTEKALKFYVDDQEKDDTFTFTDVVRDENENVGVYKLVIKLDASNNYDAAEITVYVKIEPIDGPAFTGKEYTAVYGTQLKDIVTDLPAGWSIENINTVGSKICNVRDNNTDNNKFTVVFNHGKNYNSQDPVTITIKITPAEAIINGANSVDDPYTKPYKGGAYTIEEIITGITEAHGEPLKYTLKDATSIEAATEYTVWIELDTDNVAYTGNYKIDGDKVVVKIEIQKVTIDITGITINDWKYNEYGNEKPVATGNIPSFAEDLIKYYYLYSDKADTWDDTKWVEWTDETDPTTFDAGYYKLKAVLANGGDNYVGDTFETEGVAFIVEKADATIEGIPNNKTYSNKYRGSAYTVADLFASITAKRGETTYTYTDLAYTYENGETFNGIQDFGTVKVVITLPESGNYKAATVTVTVSVTTATVELVDPAISWTFGAFNNAQPTVTIKLEGVDVTDPNLIPVTFSYYEDEACTKPITPGNTTPAGNYYIKAVVTDADNGNYSGDEAVKIFAVAKSKTASIIGVIGDETISNNAEIPLDYLPGGYSINDIFQSLSGSHNETMLEFKVGKDGVATTDTTTVKFFTEGVIKNGDEIGAYELIITLPTSNTCNYEATSLTVYVKIMPIDNKDNFEKTSFNATFGDNIWDVLSENGVVLPTGWSIQYVDETAINTDTTVGDVTAGGNKFYLVFDHGNNYNPRKEEIIFNVAPAEAEILRDGQEIGEDNNSYTAPYKGSAYDIGDIITDIAETHGLALKYTLVGATSIEGIDTYTVEITLDPDDPNYGNYELASAIEVTIEITQAGVEFGDIDIDGWEYHPENENMQTPSVETTPAVSEEDLYFEYMYSADGKPWPETWTEWTVTAPAAVGYYRVRAVVDASDAYASAVSDYTGFQITIATVTKPDFEVDENGFIKETDLELFYNGEVQTPEIDFSDYYTITWSSKDEQGNPTSTNFGEYSVTLSLIDKTNSEWNTNDTNDVTYKYRIKKADPAITINVTDKTYDKNPNQATVTITPDSLENSVVYWQDIGTAGNENWVEIGTTAPTNYGKYKVVVTVTAPEGSNYNSKTVEKEFYIHQITLTDENITTRPAFEGNKFYQSTFNVNNYTIGVTYNGEPVEGTLTWGDVKFNGGAGTVAYTFVPSDPN